MQHAAARTIATLIEILLSLNIEPVWLQEHQAHLANGHGPQHAFLLPPAIAP